MTLHKERKELRERFLKHRCEINTKNPLATVDICRHLLRWLEDNEIKVLGFYCAFRFEPDIVSAVRTWLEKDPSRIACVPVVDDEKLGKMHYSRWNPQCEMVSGAFGIKVPAVDVKVIPDTILSPCVAFNRRGYRLGNGGGFFDRYLEHRKNDSLLTIVVGYDVLETDEFIVDKHDIAFDYIATESGIRKSEI